MSVAPDIVENLGRACERPLRVDHPPGVMGRCEVAAERCRLIQVTIGGEEVHLAGSKCLVQIAQEQSSKQARVPRCFRSTWSAVAAEGLTKPR